MSEPPVAAISVRYAVRPFRDAWALPEGPVPESTTHDAAVSRLKLLLEAWILITARNARVARNLAVRWMESEPAVGLDPDVCVIEPAPAEPHLKSLRLWQAGHVVPRVCFEVVSESHPYKDYASIQDRYAAMGTRELVIFDPLLAGPTALGGPVPLQIWRHKDGVLERAHFGSGPAFSEELGAWLHPSGSTLEIAGDREGRDRWLTGEERARVALEAAERRIAELEGKRPRG